MFADILSLTPCCGCPGTDITVFDGRRARIPMGEVRCLRHNAPVCGWSLARPGTRVATAGRSVRRHHPIGERKTRPPLRRTQRDARAEARSADYRHGSAGIPRVVGPASMILMMSLAVKEMP